MTARPPPPDTSQSEKRSGDPARLSPRPNGPDPGVMERYVECAHCHQRINTPSHWVTSGRWSRRRHFHTWCVKDAFYPCKECGGTGFEDPTPWAMGIAVAGCPHCKGRGLLRSRPE